MHRCWLACACYRQPRFYLAGGVTVQTDTRRVRDVMNGSMCSPPPLEGLALDAV